MFSKKISPIFLIITAALFWLLSLSPACAQGVFGIQPWASGLPYATGIYGTGQYLGNPGLVGPAVNPYLPPSYAQYPGQYPYTPAYPSYTGYPATYPTSTGYPTYPSYTGYPTTYPTSTGYPTYPPSSTGYPTTYPTSTGYPTYPSSTGYPATYPTYTGYPNYPSSTGYPATYPNYTGYPNYPSSTGYPATYPNYTGYPNYPSSTGYPTTYPTSTGYPTYPSYTGYPATYPNYTGYPNYPPSSTGYYPPQTTTNTNPYQIADVMIDSTADGKVVKIGKGKTLGITLPSNYSTGYQWVLDTASLNTTVAQKKTSQFLAPPSQMMGAGGYEQWIFNATGVGVTTIRLDYRRYWETVAGDTFEIEVEVQ